MVGAAWLGVVLPPEAVPWASVSVAVLCAAEGLRRRSGRATAFRAKTRVSGAALLALATALALPVVERAVWPQLTHTFAPITTYLAATVVRLRAGGQRPPQQRAEGGRRRHRAVHRPNVGRHPGAAGVVGRGHDPARRHALRTAVDLLQDNARLHAELSGRIDEVRRSRARIIDAATAERQRLERVLADGVQRYLDEIEACLRSVRCPDEPATRLCSACLDEVSQLREEVTDLARGLHPRVLVERGLGPALVELTRRSPLPVDVRAPGRRYPAVAETTLWYACAEALANVWSTPWRPVQPSRSSRRGTLSSVCDDVVAGAHLAPEGGLTGLADRLADAVDADPDEPRLGHRADDHGAAAMRALRSLVTLTGLLLLSVLAPLVNRSSETTYGGADHRLLYLEVAAACALLTVSALGVPRAATLTAFVGATWLVPELAGATEVPLVARTVADAFSALLPGLTLATVALRAPQIARIRGPVVVTITGGCVAAVARLLLVDPFLEVDCWRTCDHNPLLIGDGSGRHGRAGRSARRELGCVVGGP